MAIKVKLYWWARWSSCRKARQVLSQKGADIEERDFFKTPFSERELRDLAQGRDISELFSWKSPSFKALGLDPGSLGDEDLVRLMLQEPRLVRRPIVQFGGELIIGANMKALEQALGG